MPTTRDDNYMAREEEEEEENDEAENFLMDVVRFRASAVAAEAGADAAAAAAEQQLAKEKKKEKEIAYCLGVMPAAKKNDKKPTDGQGGDFDILDVIDHNTQEAEEQEYNKKRALFEKRGIQGRGGEQRDFDEKKKKKAGHHPYSHLDLEVGNNQGGGAADPTRIASDYAVGVTDPADDSAPKDSTSTTVLNRQSAQNRRVPSAVGAVPMPGPNWNEIGSSSSGAPLAQNSFGVNNDDVDEERPRGGGGATEAAAAAREEPGLMPEARPVEDLATADPVHQDDVRRSSSTANNKASSHKTQKDLDGQRLTRCIVAFAALAALLLLVVVIIVFATSSKGDDDSDDAGTSTPTMAPTLPPTSFLDLIDLPQYTKEVILGGGENTPQLRAYNWLMGDPDLDKYPDWRVVQRFALATFYYATGGSSWSGSHSKGWLEYGGDECTDWKFTTFGAESFYKYVAPPNASVCDEEGNYISLIHSNKGLVGTIPPEVSLLSKLRYLDYSNHLEHVRGSIPSELFLLTDLILLACDRNAHTGIIPTEIGRLSNLVEVNIGTNPYGPSPLPSELGLLAPHGKLKQIDVNRAGISGTLPSEIYALTSLEELRLHGLTGGITGDLHGMASLTQLRKLTLYDMQLDQTIPSELGLLTNVIELNFWNTGLRGTIPSEFWLLSRLTRFDFDDLFLTGTFPVELSGLTNLEILYLNGNQLTSTLPASVFAGLTNLREFSIHNNPTSGTIPTEIGALSQAAQLGMQNMGLTGAIPSELGLASNLYHVFLHQNNLNGTVPNELTLLSNLGMLVISDTTLTGSIPEELCGMVKEIEFVCTVVYGVVEQICTSAAPRNFTCELNSEEMCGCVCGPCPDE